MDTQHSRRRGSVTRRWLSAWTLRHRFRGAISPGTAGHREAAFGAWIGRLSRSACSHRFRKRTIGTVSVDDLQRSPELAGEQDCVDTCEMLDDVWDAVLVLPPRQRLVALYRICFGYSTARVATLLECRPGTIQAALFAAKRSLSRTFRPRR